MPLTGAQYSINVDTVDKAITWATPAYYTNQATGMTTFWIGTLGSGSHTIQGKFATGTASSTATISNRALLVYILNGTEFQYVDDTTSVNSTTGLLVDDTAAASFTFTPSGSCQALYLYNIICDNGESNEFPGMGAAISVAGTDYGLMKDSPTDTAYGLRVFTCYAGALTAVSTTVKGRYKADVPTYTQYVTRRQLGVLLFDNGTLLDLTTSNTTVSSTSGSLADDTQATINRNLSDTRELLCLAVANAAGYDDYGYLGYGADSDGHGPQYGIYRGADKTNSRAAACDDSRPVSTAVVWAENLTAGDQTIKGRLAINYTTGPPTVTICSRVLIGLWLAVSAGTNYPISLASTTTISDTEIRKVIRAISSTTTEASSLSRIILNVKALSSAITEASALTRLAILPRSLSSTITETSALSTYAIKVQALSSSITEAGSITRLAIFTRPISSTLTETDALARMALKIQALSSTITEGSSLSRVFIRPVALSGATNLLDAISIVYTAFSQLYQIGISGTLTLSGAITRNLLAVRSLSSTSTLAGEINLIKGFIIALGSATTISSDISRTLVAIRNISTTHILSSSLTRTTVVLRGMSEVYSISGTLTAARLKIIYITESINSISSIVKITYIYRTINSPVIISETLSRLLFRPINIGETVQITDLIGLYSIYAIQLSNSIILDSSVVRIKLAVRGLGASLTLSDTLTRQVIYIRGLNSILILLDALNKSSVYIVSIVNSVKLVDVLGRGLSYRIAIANILAITSEITKIATEERRGIGQEMATMMDSLKNRVITIHQFGDFL